MTGLPIRLTLPTPVTGDRYTAISGRCPRAYQLYYAQLLEIMMAQDFQDLTGQVLSG